MHCSHKATKRDWARTPSGIMKLHPYCDNCGTLKNVSSDKGKKFSYFVAAMSRLRKLLEKKGYKISEAQIRLVLKELSEIDGFTDIWWITFTKQKEIFVNVVQKYVRISKALIESVL